MSKDSECKLGLLVCQDRDTVRKGRSRENIPEGHGDELVLKRRVQAAIPQDRCWNVVAIL